MPKSTTCRVLAEQFGAAVIPEVNALFTRPNPAPPTWYLERQAERWRLAREALATHPFSVLDGDPFQPLWYNWSFDYKDFQPPDALRAFYRPLIASGALAFPDVYVHLTICEDELRRRKETDATRTRRNFDSHLRLLYTQPRYFAAMAALTPGLVETVEAVNVEGNVARIAEIAAGGRGIHDHVAVFDGLIEWLGSHSSHA